MTAYEAKRPPLEQELHVARWALHRCRRFTAVCPKVVIHLPDPAEVVVMADKTHHLRLEALRVDLESYRAEFRQAETELQMWVDALIPCGGEDLGEE